MSALYIRWAPDGECKGHLIGLFLRQFTPGRRTASGSGRAASPHCSRSLWKSSPPPPQSSGSRKAPAAAWPAAGTAGAAEPFDLVFIDADKRHYIDYYRVVKPRVAPGGFILADNTLWDGHVVDDAKPNECSSKNNDSAPLNGKDAQTQGIKDFNDLVAEDPDVERVILPLRDGLTIIRKGGGPL